MDTRIDHTIHQQTTTTADVIARLLAAYQEVATCEAWLAGDASRRDTARLRSLQRMSQAQARMRELAEEK